MAPFHRQLLQHNWILFLLLSLNFLKVRENPNVNGYIQNDMKKAARLELASLSTAKRSDPGLVGWREWVGLPGLNVSQIKAKIDTGARTSALHATDIQFLKKHGKNYVRFAIQPVQRQSKPLIWAEAPLVEQRKVKSSHGHVTTRPVIHTEVKIGNELVPIELTLVNRDLMGFRMLLGRQAVKGRYFVDPSRSFLIGKKKVKKKLKKAGAL